MAIPVRPHIDTPHSRYRVLVTDDGSRSLVDTVLDESYHSGCGAAAESYVVYLANSGVSARLLSDTREPTRVLEYGFGTGMNFIMTAALAVAQQTPLHFTSLEYRLLPADVLEMLQLDQAIESAINKTGMPGGLEQAQRITQEFIRFRRSLPETPPAATHIFQASPDVQLELVLGDAVAYSPQPDHYHAVYFDAFSPKTNPDLWTDQVIQTAYQSLLPMGKLVTYCVNSAVQRLMRGAGFEICKAPGPVGGKREVLIAIKPSGTSPKAQD